MKQDSNFGCGFSIAVFVILALISLIIEYTAIFFIVLAILAVIGGIVALIFHEQKKEREAREAQLRKEEAERLRIESEQRRRLEAQRRKEEERQRNLNIISQTEPKPSLLFVPATGSFLCAAEAEVNRQFREFLNQKNTITTQSAHLDFLTRKAAAFRALNRPEDADLLHDEIRKASIQVSALKSAKVVYQSENNSLMYRDPVLQSAYSAFLGVLDKNSVALLDEFFQSSIVKIVKAGVNDVLVFTPAYVLSYIDSEKVFYVVPYKKIGISTKITTELQEGGWKSGDEISHTRYLYETRDGFRDMRYSYANNPSYTYVYRGKATITCGKLVYEKSFNNKSTTEAFEKSFKEYVALVCDKYQKIVDQVLCNKKNLSDIGSVEAFLAQEAKKAEELKAAEAARREREARERKYSKERNVLLAKVKLLRTKAAPCWQYSPGGAMIEERFLNEAYLEFDTAKRDAARIEECNSFIEKHKDEFQALNYHLRLPIDADMAEWQLIVAAEAIPEALPERFVKLNLHFSKLDEWKCLKQESQSFASRKIPRTTVCGMFFSGMDLCFVKKNDATLFFFPYCMVLFCEKRPMTVISYRDAVAEVSFHEEEIVSESVPEHGEVVRERYTHLNVDGSVSKRYKNNPLIKTIRYTKVRVKGKNFAFEFPVDKYDSAVLFINAFTVFVNAFMNEDNRDIYSKVLTSAPLEEIETLIEFKEKEKQERIRLTKLQAKAEARRQEELRKEEERAAEERRKALIQRQKELNEERRRKLAEEEERKKRVESMFRDDFEKDGSSGKEPSVKIETSEIDVPFEVIGKRMISNSVFKVTLRCLDSVSLGTLTASFVSLCGERISNLKQITLQTGEDVTLGFVLNPGRDFTEMKGCYLRLESEGVVVGDLLFEMNISFSNDF